MQNTDNGFNVPQRLMKEDPKKADREKKQQKRAASKAPKAKGGVAGGEV
jgi:hypothetical protein